MLKYIGTTDEDVARAEHKAYELASEHGGAKQFHVIEAGKAGKMQGAVFIADNEGIESLEADVDAGLYDWSHTLYTKGYEED